MEPIAAHAGPAERLAFDERPGDAAVDVEVADPELAAGARYRRRAARDEPAGERVRAVVGDAQGFVEVARPQDAQHRTEDLLLGDHRLGIDVDEDVRSHVVAAAGPAAGRLAGLECERGFAPAAFDVVLDARLGFGGDDGTDARGRQVGRSDGQAAGGFDEARDEGVVRSVEDDRPRARGALLAGVAEGGGHGLEHRLVEVGVVVDDDGVLAAHLGDHLLDAVPAGVLRGQHHDLQADVARAGEGDQVDIGIDDQRLCRRPHRSRAGS